MGYTPTHLGHVNIYVRNAEEAHQWYEDILGLHTYDFVPGRAAFMSANRDESHEIALMEVGADAPGPEAKRVGLNHMAWRMDSLDDLKEFYHRLKDRDIAMGIGDHGISLGIYFNDPDGNGIEVYYELPREQWHRQENLFLPRRHPQRPLPRPVGRNPGKAEGRRGAVVAPGCSGAPARVSRPRRSGEGRNPENAWYKERDRYQTFLDSGLRRNDGGDLFAYKNHRRKCAQYPIKGDTDGYKTLSRG